jgi:CubicO group peptidase (beta-lactamase class C family)
MTVRSFGLGLLLLSSLRAFAAEPEQPPRSLDELKQRIETIVTETRTPAIGIALVGREGPSWVAGWGKANVAKDTAADQDTLFRIGSISKMFAALAVLKLVEEGRLSLDDKVRDRAPEIAFENAWERTHPVRVAHLLEHTTGWDDTHLPEYAYSAPDTMSIKQGLDFHPHSRTSRWPPGTRHAYCNSGAPVAAYIVEKVTGRRFEDYVAQTFFAPIGMESTSYFRTKLYDERGATLYQGPMPQEYWQLIHRPAGSINSSARDMAKFVHFMLLRGATAAGPVVSPASFDRMETPGTLPGNAAGVRAGYALGNYTSGHKALGVAFHGHNGGVMGGLSELAYSNELGQGYVIMINSGNGAALGRISTALKDYLLRDAKPPEIRSAALPGAYREIDGYYQPINPRNESMRMMMGIMGVFKVTHDDRYLNRSPLFGGWTSEDYAGESAALVDRWNGLPAIAIVDDPLVGPALQTGSDLLQRISGWRVFARVATPALLILMTVVGVIAFIVWLARRVRKKTDDGRLWMRLWPLIASASLVAFLIAMALSGVFLKALGSVSPLSIGLFVMSFLYPVAVLIGTAQLFTARTRERKNLPYWFAAAFAVVHLLTAGYLAIHGSIGLRTWA